MKLWLKFICSGAAVFALLATASAQVLRVDMTSPANESSLAFQPGTRQATATATLAGGALTGVTLHAAGSGYTTAPTVTFSGGGGTGAAALVTFNPVNTVTLNAGGAGYSSAPTVTISGGGGFGATATAAIGGGGNVTGIILNSGGSGYTSAPTVTISGGGGAGATASATILNGIQSITLTSGGTGYFTVPTVTISAPPTGGTQATATVDGITPRGVDTIAIVDPGAGYVGTPTVTLSGGGGTGATATAVMAGDLVGAITITAPGSGFLVPPTVTIAPPNGVVVLNAQVTGTASIYHTVFYVDGLPVSYTILGNNPQSSWAPPQPGSYYITAKTSDDFGNSTVSLPVRVFIVGTKIQSPVPNTLVPFGSSVVIAADATQASGFIKQIEFFVNGVSIGVDTTAPYSIAYQPPALGTYNLTAVATDNNGALLPTSPVVPISVITPIGSLPTVNIVNPVAGSNVAAGTTINIIGNAADADGYIQKVEFYINGTLINTAQAFPYTASWSPVIAGRYYLVAMAFDDKANAVASTPALITVTAGFPTISITTPVAGTAPYPQGKKVAVSVNAAGSDGGITSLSKIEFLVDGNVNDTLPKNPNNITPPPVLTQPFNFTWASNVTLGTHRLSARVTDSQGLSITSADVVVSVVANQLPVVTITSPQAYVPLRAGYSTTIQANATDADGSIDNVEFFVNGASLGAITSAPFSVTWVPKTEGPYTLVAKATDDCGGVTSASLSVTVSAAASAAANNSVFRGSYQGTGESGQFTFISLGSKSADFIGYAPTTPAKIYFYSGIAVDANGGFSQTDATGRTLISGQISATGVVGTFNPTGAGAITFIGPIVTGSTTSTVTPGYYGGSVSGNLATQVTSIVGPDGNVTFFVTDGTFRDAGMSTYAFTSTGGFTATLAGGTKIANGKIDAATGFLTGTISGTMNGSILGAFASGLSVSDGELRSLSTRGQAGTGDNMLIAGFIVSGNTPKQVLIRAVGPTLGAAPYNVSGTVTDPQFSVTPLGGSAAVASNDNWGGTAALQAAFAQAYAFALPTASKDAAAVATLPPGGYTVQVSSVTGVSGVALVELYDLDVVSPFTTQKLTGVSTRGLVGAGDKSLIAGININGTMPKKLLIRAVGPTLTTLGVSNALSNPVLTIKSGNSTVRENASWGTGNDSALVTDATTNLGIVALPSGSKDAVILLSLPPGLYSAVVSGANGATGIALVEVYEVP
jgi:hypothetical protein